MAQRLSPMAIMKTAKETIVVFDLLDEQHPGADTELHFSDAYELLVATILSAQSTDQRVNMVTPALFKRYRSAQAMAKATAAELEPQIHSTGFFRAKSKALIGMAQALVERHGGEVPPDMDALTALPGVGRKTANVVLGHALGVPGLPVDRHVLRVANRIGVAEGDDPEKVEAHLCSLLPPDRWTRASDCLILHGRRVCKPKPLCPTCLVQDYCDYFRSGATTDVRKTGDARPSGRAAKESVKGAVTRAPAAARRAKTARPASTKTAAERSRLSRKPGKRSK